MPDFNLQSRFDPNQNYKAVKFGKDAKVLEVELNEVQDIIQHREQRVTETLYHDGIFEGYHSSYNPEPDNYFYVYENIVGVIRGEFFQINALRIDMSKYSVGQELYLTKSERVISHTDSVPLQGYLGDVPPGMPRTVPNTLFDARINEETSRRIQTQIMLTTSGGENSMLFGTIVPAYSVDSKAFHEEFNVLVPLRDFKGGGGIELLDSHPIDPEIGRMWMIRPQE